MSTFGYLNVGFVLFSACLISSTLVSLLSSVVCFGGLVSLFGIVFFCSDLFLSRLTLIYTFACEMIGSLFTVYWHKLLWVFAHTKCFFFSLSSYVAAHERIESNKQTVLVSLCEGEMLFKNDWPQFHLMSKHYYANWARLNEFWAQAYIN